MSAIAAISLSESREYKLSAASGAAIVPMTTNVVVCVGELRKCILCAPGMAVNELRYVLGAAFEVDARLIAGSVSEEGVCSPFVEVQFGRHEWLKPTEVSA